MEVSGRNVAHGSTRGSFQPHARYRPASDGAREAS